MGEKKNEVNLNSGAISNKNGFYGGKRRLMMKKKIRKHAGKLKGGRKSNEKEVDEEWKRGREERRLERISRRWSVTRDRIRFAVDRQRKKICCRNIRR